jgi:hypothetical protein
MAYVKSRHLLAQLKARGIPEHAIDLVIKHGWLTIDNGVMKYTMNSGAVQTCLKKGINMKKLINLRVVVGVNDTIITAYFIDKRVISMCKLNKKKR